MIRGRLRWLVPVAVGAVAAAAAVAPHALANGGHPSLPPRSVAQLVSELGRSATHGFSGELRTVADLGLPQLPTTVGSSQLVDLISGAAELHVWAAGSGRVRAALLGTGQEIDVVHDGGTTWWWNSTTQSATRITAAPTRPPAAAQGPIALGSVGGIDLTALTPAALGRWAGRFIGRDTAVTLGPTTVVAGRAAYDLRIQPRRGDTLLSRIDVAMDAATGLPLQVQLWSRLLAAQPAFSVGFTAVSLSAPPASIFAFRPPVGARVSTSRISGTGLGGRGGPRVFGRGWASVIATPPLTSGATGRSGSARSGGSAPLADVTRAVPGGQLLTTNLLSVFLGDDGRVVAGVVPDQRVQRIAVRTARPAVPAAGR